MDSLIIFQNERNKLTKLVESFLGRDVTTIIMDFIKQYDWSNCMHDIRYAKNDKKKLFKHIFFTRLKELFDIVDDVLILYDNLCNMYYNGTRLMTLKIFEKEIIFQLDDFINYVYNEVIKWLCFNLTGLNRRKLNLNGIRRIYHHCIISHIYARFVFSIGRSTIKNTYIDLSSPDGYDLYFIYYRYLINLLKNLSKRNNYQYTVRNNLLENKFSGFCKSKYHGNFYLTKDQLKNLYKEW